MFVLSYIKKKKLLRKKNHLSFIQNYLKLRYFEVGRRGHNFLFPHFFITEIVGESSIKKRKKKKCFFGIQFSSILF